MDDITILKNRLAYFSNRVYYKSDFEEIDLKIDYEKETEPDYKDEINEEDYKEYIRRELVDIVKRLIKNGVIDFYKNTYKELRKKLNESKELGKILNIYISREILRELIDENYNEFVNEQKIVYEKEGKKYEEVDEQEVDEQEVNEEDKDNMKLGKKMKFGKKMKKFLKDLKK